MTTTDIRDDVVLISNEDFEQAYLLTPFLRQLELYPYEPALRRTLMEAYVNLTCAPTDQWRTVWEKVIAKAVDHPEFGLQPIDITAFAAELHPAIGPLTGRTGQWYRVVDQ